MIALPTSIFGALVPMNIGLASINIYTQIGFVCLIGLIAKHGILMVDFANKLQDDQGYGRAAAIEYAAAVRLRPILMTTAATVVAMVPLLVVSGAGAGARFSIGLVIAAGMTIGTLFTLFVTPAMYTFLAQDRQGAKAKHEAKAKKLSEAEVKALDVAAGAGVQFAAEPKGETEAEPKKGPVSSGAKASKSGAKAASTSASGKRRPRKSPRRQTRKTLPTAAE